MIVEIGSVLLGLMGIFLGITLIAVGSGQYHFAPNQRFTPMTVYKSPKFLNNIEMIIGFLFVLMGIVMIIAVFSNWQPFNLDVISLSLTMSVMFSIVLFIGYVKPLSFTVLRNISRAGVLPRVLGVILFMVTVATWSSQSSVAGGIDPTVPPDGVLPNTLEPTITISTADNSIHMARFNQDQIKDGDTVTQSIAPVDGTHQNIPAEYELWIVVESGERCYPMNGPVKLELSTGIWRHTGIHFPQIGTPYLLSLVIADSNASAALRDAVGNQPGFLCSSIETEGWETISVTVVDEE